MKIATVANQCPYDFLGVILSTICGIHCLLTPLAMIYLPTLAKYLEPTGVHTLLIGFVALSFHQSIYLHYKFHRSKLTFGAGLLGFVILLSTYLFEVFSHSHEHSHIDGNHKEYLMMYLTVSGAILLVISHILNIRKCLCLNSRGPCSAGTNSR